MKRIQTLSTRNLRQSMMNGGCGECQTSCQSACKTSCGVANQPCESTRVSRIKTLNTRNLRQSMMNADVENVRLLANLLVKHPVE